MAILSKLGSSLRDSLNKIMKAGMVDKKVVEELVSDIKTALIRADTNVELADQISNNIKNRAIKEKPAPGLTAREHTVNIVYEELVKFAGKEQGEIKVDKKPTVILLVGLFGSGKTTSAGKLAKYYKKQNLKVAVVQTDTWRPAAYEQLNQLAEKLHVPFYGKKGEKNPITILKEAQPEFKKYDVVIVDSAGRDALNDELIIEIKNLNSELNPNEVLLVMSGDIGQDAENQAKAFHKAVNITGVVITKLDGTAKGGGALIACAQTGAKVKFIGTGERFDDFEVFKPKNFISRLLGMGDLETLLEKAETAISKDQAEKIGKRVKKGDFTLDDLREQMGAVKKMGSLSQITSMIPGMGGMKLPAGKMEEQEGKMESWKFLMDSMTAQERDNPDLINPSRVARIAKGSGREEQEVRDLLKQYKQMKKMMKMVSSPKKMKQLEKMFGKGGLPPGLMG